jgi:hypothetical protein
MARDGPSNAMPLIPWRRIFLVVTEVLATGLQVLLFLNSVAHIVCATITTSLNSNFMAHFYMRHKIPEFLWRVWT